VPTSGARIGVVYPPAAIKVLLDLVGPATTKYLLFSGDLLTAEDALTKGLVDRVFPADTLEPETSAFAGTLISRSQLTIRSAKETVTALLANADADSTAYTRYLETITTGELTEGVSAFTQKRRPNFLWSG
jgi:enoyl-CoA hydratase/carnithine racemase